MRYCILTTLGIYILTACTYHPREKRLTKFKNNDSQILKSFYLMKGDTIEFTRILKMKERLTIQDGEIFPGGHSLINQSVRNEKVIVANNEVIDSLAKLFIAKGLTTKLWGEREVMFIQIVPDSSMSDLNSLKFLNLRQEIESKIDVRLKNQNLGEWFAGDMGAGANMLFFIDNWGKANEMVLQVLKEEDLIDHVLIAKRLMTAKDDWTYEIVYPLEYQGPFNQM